MVRGRSTTNGSKSDNLLVLVGETSKDLEHVSQAFGIVIARQPRRAILGRWDYPVNVLSTVPSTSHCQVVLLVIAFQRVCAQD